MLRKMMFIENILFCVLYFLLTVLTLVYGLNKFITISQVLTSFGGDRYSENFTFTCCNTLPTESKTARHTERRQ